MSNPQEEVYKEYLNYDWDSFDEFQEGLKEILDNYLATLRESDPSVTSIPALDKHQLVEQAKSFFYCTRTGNILNLDDFEQWKLDNGAKYNTKSKIVDVSDVADTIAKKVPEQVQESQKVVNSGSSDPPYSSNYQELVELIVSGKPVPGIKDIPDTVLSEQSSVSAAPARTKPWEK